MKNRSKYLITLILTVTFFSCHKNDGESLEINDVSTENTRALFDFTVDVKNDMLSFPKRDDYEKALSYLGPLREKGFSEWENMVGFKSMRSGIEVEKREEMGIFDNLLATLINENAMIEIAGNVFVLNALDETVAVIPSENFNKSNLSSKKMTIYSTDDNILDIMEGNDVPLSLTEKAKYCGKTKKSGGDDIFYSYKIVYQKAGFLNSLQSKIQHHNGMFGDHPDYFNIGLKTVGNNFWRNKKHSAPIPQYDSGYENPWTKSYRPYYSSRRLQDYSFSIEFITQSKNNLSVDRKTLSIRCN